MTPTYQLDNSKSNGEPVDGVDYDILAEVVESQLQGALASGGEGIVESAAGTAWVVTAGTSTTVNIAPGAGNVGLGDSLIFVKSASTYALTRPNLSTFYVYVRVRRATTAFDPDSTRDAVAIFEAGATVPADGALALARVTNAGIESLRTFTKPDQALRRVAQLEADVGYNATERAKGSIAARLNALTEPIAPGDEDAASIAALQAQVNALKTSHESLAAFVDELAARIGLPGLEAAVGDTDRFEVREVARQTAHHVHLDPAYSLLTDASVVIAGTAGDAYDFGNGLTSRDVRSGNTTPNFDEGSES